MTFKRIQSHKLHIFPVKMLLFSVLNYYNCTITWILQYSEIGLQWTLDEVETYLACNFCNQYKPYVINGNPLKQKGNQEHDNNRN